MARLHPLETFMNSCGWWACGSIKHLRRSGLPAAFAALFILVLSVLPVRAVEPSEMLDDPVLEERAQDLGQEVRCLVCRSESVEDSNADLARDLRLVIRERLLAGDSDQDVRDFLVARYGEYVLLNPRFGGTTCGSGCPDLCCCCLGLQSRLALFCADVVTSRR